MISNYHSPVQSPTQQCQGLDDGLIANGHHQRADLLKTHHNITKSSSRKQAGWYLHFCSIFHDIISAFFAFLFCNIISAWKWSHCFSIYWFFFTQISNKNMDCLWRLGSPYKLQCKTWFHFWSFSRPGLCDRLVHCQQHGLIQVNRKLIIVNQH